MTRSLAWQAATVDVETVPPQGLAVSLDAGAPERAAIAERLGIPGVEAVTASFTLRPFAGDATEVRGVVQATLVRTCVVTDEPMTEAIDEAVTCLIVSEEPAEAEEEDPDEPDYEVAPDGIVDLADLAEQYLALAMTSYPRRPEADAELAALQPRMADDGAGTDNPFAALGQRLKGKPGAGEGGTDG